MMTPWSRNINYFVNLCLIVICLFLISVQTVVDNEYATVVHGQSRGSDNYQM